MTDAGREPVDLASLHAADALFDRLATRTHDTSAENDSTVRLLRALLEDVDGRPETKPLRGNNRRAACATAAMGVAAAVLATTGVAAAAGGWIEPTTKRASVHSSKPASTTKSAQPKQEQPARHVPAGRLTKPRPKPGPPLEPVPPPAVTEPEAPGMYDLGHESRPTVSKPTDIREYVRQRLEDGTWR